MAVEKETQLEAWLEENMPEPSGEDIATVTGNLANPFGIYKEQISTILKHEGVISISVYGFIGSHITLDNDNNINIYIFDGVSLESPYYFTMYRFIYLENSVKVYKYEIFDNDGSVGEDSMSNWENNPTTIKYIEEE